MEHSFWKFRNKSLSIKMIYSGQGNVYLFMVFLFKPIPKEFCRKGKSQVKKTYWKSELKMHKEVCNRRRLRSVDNHYFVMNLLTT